MPTKRAAHDRTAKFNEKARGSKVMLHVSTAPARQETPSPTSFTSAVQISTAVEPGIALLRIQPPYNITNYSIASSSNTTVGIKALSSSTVAAVAAALSGSVTSTATTTTTTTTTLENISSGAGLATGSQEDINQEFYKSYNPSTGFHTAAVLGSILVWLVLYLIYRTKVKRCLLRVKRRFEGEDSLDSVYGENSLNAKNNNSIKYNGGIEEQIGLAEEDVCSSDGDGGGGECDKKDAQFQDMSDSFSNSGTGTNPIMTRTAAFINPSIVIEASPSTSPPFSPIACGAGMNGVPFTDCENLQTHHCDIGAGSNPAACYYCNDDQENTAFQFPCTDNHCIDHQPYHPGQRDDIDRQISPSACSPCHDLHDESNQLRPRRDHHHRAHRHHHHHHHRHHHYVQPHQQQQQQDETCLHALPKSILDIPSATARWVENVPMAMRSYQDISMGDRLQHPAMGPLAAIYKPCSCPMVYSPSPQQPLQTLQFNQWNNNSMPELPGSLSQQFPAYYFDEEMWYGCGPKRNGPRRRNNNAASDVLDIINAKRKKMQRRKRRASAYADGTVTNSKRRESDSNSANKVNTMLDQVRRHSSCVPASNGHIEDNPSSRKSSLRGRPPTNLTISIPESNTKILKNASNSISNNIAFNDSKDTYSSKSPVPLPVTPTVTIQNSCGPSYHHRRHTRNASVSSSSSDLIMLPIPLPNALCSQPLPLPPKPLSPSAQFLSHTSGLCITSPSSPSRRLPSQSSPRPHKPATPTSPRIPSPHLLHPTSESVSGAGGNRGKGRSRSPSPSQIRSCCSTPCVNEPPPLPFLLSPEGKSGSVEDTSPQTRRRACSFSHRPNNNTKSSAMDRRNQHSCSFKVSRPRNSSSSSSKQSAPADYQRLPPRTGSGLSGESRPSCLGGVGVMRGIPSEGHIARAASSSCLSPGGAHSLSSHLRCHSGELYSSHGYTNTDFSPTSPVTMDRASLSISPTSSAPSSYRYRGAPGRHRPQHQRSMSVSDEPIPRTGRDGGAVSPTWSNPSTRTSQGGGASLYSHSPSPHLLQVPDCGTIIRPVTPDNNNTSSGYSSHNNNSQCSGCRNHPHCNHRFQRQHQHHSLGEEGSGMVSSQLRHCVLSESNLAYYKNQLYLDGDGASNDDPAARGFAGNGNIPIARRHSSIVHSTGGINMPRDDQAGNSGKGKPTGTDGSGGAGPDNQSSRVANHVPQSSSFGSSSSYGSSLHPNYPLQQIHHQYHNHHKRQGHTPQRQPQCSPTDNQNGVLTGPNQNISSQKKTISPSPNQNLNSRVMETKL